MGVEGEPWVEAERLVRGLLFWSLPGDERAAGVTPRDDDDSEMSLTLRSMEARRCWISSICFSYWLEMTTRGRCSVVRAAAWQAMPSVLQLAHGMALSHLI